ncbi:CinA family protein [Kitasatospora sp. NPDC059463]|uniref:CinA family protein n=1 Tax=unclassified Kitasatospora TaxID=2633591 RepID=UPI0036CA039D
MTNPTRPAGRPDPGAGAATEEAGVLARQVTAALTATGHTVAVAESLTAGRLAAALAEVPGAGQAFLGGIVAYATETKETLLGVDAALLADAGPVHPRVAVRMAEGVRASVGATYGLATTGVAGPASQDGHEPGTVFVAVAGPSGSRTASPPLSGSGPQAVQAGTVRAALRLLRDSLRPDP